MDMKMMVAMFANEFFLENTPQLIIQLVNNTQRRAWTATGIVSLATSCYFLIKGIFEPCMKIFWSGKTLSEAFAYFEEDDTEAQKPSASHWCLEVTHK